MDKSPFDSAIPKRILVKDLPTDQLFTKESESCDPNFSSRKDFVSEEWAEIKLFFSDSDIDLYFSPTIFSSFTIMAD